MNEQQEEKESRLEELQVRRELYVPHLLLNCSLHHKSPSAPSVHLGLGLSERL